MTAGFASDVDGSVTLAKSSWLVAPLRHADNTSKTVIAIGKLSAWVVDGRFLLFTVTGVNDYFFLYNLQIDYIPTLNINEENRRHCAQQAHVEMIALE